MPNIDLNKVLTEKFDLKSKIGSEFWANLLLKIIKKVTRINEINYVLNKYPDKKNFDFIDEVFEYLDFSYSVSRKHKLRIPSEGKLILVSNHPMGGLDALAILNVISEVRSDVKFIANDLLLHLHNLSGLFLPFDIFTKKNYLANFKKIEKHLQKEGVLAIFPAAKVSRLSLKGIKDSKWLNGAVKLAKKHDAPILPVFVDARNSITFYIASMLYKKLSTALLPREIFKQKSKTINIKIGHQIPAEILDNSALASDDVLSKLLKKHVYKMGGGKKVVFKTKNNIIHPVNVKSIKNDLLNSELLGKTKDGKKIFLTDHKNSPNAIKEISRLREITFRKVGEGTGKKADLDRYDKYFKQIVLWDEKDLEIVGSYRIGIGKDIIANQGLKGFYNSSLFELDDSFKEKAVKGIELGRSFIQQKYWKTTALDYLWQGIGAYLSKNPDTRYLFGAVSISAAYSKFAKDLIIYYYNKWYNYGSKYAKAKIPYEISDNRKNELAEIFAENSPEKDFRALKVALRNLGFTTPVLYRKYVDLCELGGAEFVDFCVNNFFNNSIDGFILLDLDMIKEEKKERYYITQDSA